MPSGKKPGKSPVTHHPTLFLTVPSGVLAEVSRRTPWAEKEIQSLLCGSYQATGSGGLWPTFQKTEKGLGRCRKSSRSGEAEAGRSHRMEGLAGSRGKLGERPERG